MSANSDITRRDFLNGVALSLAAGTTLSPLELLAAGAAGSPYYPPSLTGMRGNHPGSFEVAHALAMGGASFERPAKLTDSEYDLVVVGGGISGLAAAKHFRDRAGKDVRILVLDNHDDFGGHAKRNEFEVNGETLIGYGGSQSLESPGSYSAEAKALLADLGIVPQRFYDYFDRGFSERHGLREGIFFPAEHYGRDVTAINLFAFRQSAVGIDEARDIVAAYPISDAARRSLIQLIYDEKDYLPGLANEAKKAHLRSISYTEFLQKHTGTSEEAIVIIRDATNGYWGFGWDALSALEAFRMRMPGLAHMGIETPPKATLASDEPYIFHFPDGNASVARLLVRDLIPAAAPGSSMEDIVTARMDYSVLDESANPVRLRLNSTAVDVAHSKGRNRVDVSYVRNGKTERVRGRHVILACYNHVVPHLCAELPQAQREAIESVTKTPLVYLSIAIRNWQAFKKLGLHSVYQPQSDMMYSFGLDFPVSMGGYDFTASPDEPAIVHGTFTPTAPGKGLTQKEQNRAGRRRLLGMSFADFENGIRRQLEGALGAGGFHSKDDILAITVNRWPHGYAYEYNDLYDPPDFGREKGPHIAGRARIGRISIANSDASAYAYVDGAIDAAVRAADEQLAL